MITAGDYEGAAVKGGVQFGESEKGTLQIGITMDLFKGEENVGQMTTILYFSDGAAVYSYERLRLMGWEGEDSQDIDKLDAIFGTRVPVRVTAPEEYVAADGTKKLGQSKLEILTGGGTLQFNKPLTPDIFKARLAAIGGSSGGGGNAPSNGGGSKPPF